jgi:ArsR family transcriptional regulator
MGGSFSVASCSFNRLSRISISTDIDFCIDSSQYTAMRNSPASVVPCCPTVLTGRLKKTDAEQLALGFKAIADPGRLQLLNFIAAQSSGEACVCHLMKPLDVKQPTVSHHLKVLYDAGLLDRERRGTWVYYRIVPERLAALRDALAVGSTGGANTTCRVAVRPGRGQR